jgi:hypothetical protein
MLSGTSISVMSHCNIHHECERTECIIFSTWKNDVILYLDVTSFIVISGCNIMGFNPLTN